MCNVNVDEKFPQFEFEKELTFDMSATMFNGLDISFKDTLTSTDIDAEENSFELSLGGAFGSIQIKDSASAVDSMLVGTAGSIADTAIDVTSDGHVTSTSGSDDGLKSDLFHPIIWRHGSSVWIQQEY